MEKITPLEAFQKAHGYKAEYEYLKATLGMCPPPAFRIERNPPKKRLQQELRLLSKKPAFHDIVRSIRKRFWIPLYRTFAVYSSDPEHEDLSDLIEYLWIDLMKRVRNLREGIEIKVGGMDSNDYGEWAKKLIGEKSHDLGEPQQGLFRLHIRWLLNELGLPGQYGQALEQYILFGYADPVPAFEMHMGDHADIYQSADSSLCIEIYPYTKASDITKHWREVQQSMKHLWGTRGARPKIAPNLERDFEWYRLVTQEHKSPKDIVDSYLGLDRKTTREIADSDLEIDYSHDEIDETIVRSAVNRIKKRFEANE